MVKGKPTTNNLITDPAVCVDGKRETDNRVADVGGFDWDVDGERVAALAPSPVVTYCNFRNIRML